MTPRERRALVGGGDSGCDPERLSKDELLSKGTARAAHCGLAAAILALSLSLCIAAPVMAQEATKPPLILGLRIGSIATVQPFVALLREKLGALGYADGRNLRLDIRVVEHVERLSEMAEALVREAPTVIVTFGEAATPAAQNATRVIPIVAAADDLVAAKLVASLARPGGNTTGVSILATELDPKKLEVLKEILPAARHVGILNDPTTSVPSRLTAISQTARVLGIDVQIVDVREPADFEAAFAALRAGGADSVNILASPILSGSEVQLGALSLQYRIPAICQFREMAEKGCLASYGITRSELFTLLAGSIDKVLKGARPSDIPVQQPTNFELVINRRVARALGVELPAALLVRAEVIE
jgi:putative ABC transport system substrate-binding protein